MAAFVESAQQPSEFIPNKILFFRPANF